MGGGREVKAPCTKKRRCALMGPDGTGPSQTEPVHWQGSGKRCWPCPATATQSQTKPLPVYGAGAMTPGLTVWSHSVTVGPSCPSCLRPPPPRPRRLRPAAATVPTQQAVSDREKALVGHDSLKLEVKRLRCVAGRPAAALVGHADGASAHIWMSCCMASAMMQTCVHVWEGRRRRFRVYPTTYRSVVHAVTCSRSQRTR